MNGKGGVSKALWLFFGSTLNCMGFTILIVLFKHKQLLFLNHLRHLRSYKFDKHTALISYTTHPYYNELIDLHL